MNSATKTKHNWAPLTDSLRILHSNETSSLVQFEMNPDLSNFEGHFLDNPILPAASILEFSLFLARELKIFPQQSLQRIRSAKFLAPIRPGQKIQIDFQHEKDQEKSIVVVWKIFSDDDQSWAKAADFDFSATKSPTKT